MNLLDTNALRLHTVLSAMTVASVYGYLKKPMKSMSVVFNSHGGWPTLMRIQVVTRKKPYEHYTRG